MGGKGLFMKSLKLSIVLLTLILFASLATPVFADVMIRQLNSTDAFEMMGQQVPAKSDTSVVWIGDGVARFDVADTATMIFNASENTIALINHTSKSYSMVPLGQGGEMDISKMMDTEGMSEEEIAEAKAAMQGMMGAMQLKMTVTPTEESKKIKDWNCKKYTVVTDMGMVKAASESWVTNEIKLNYDLFFNVTRAFMAMMPGFEDAMKEFKKMEGMPVWSETNVDMMGAKVHSTTELLEYKEASAPAGTYKIPEGYKESK